MRTLIIIFLLQILHLPVYGETEKSWIGISSGYNTNINVINGISYILSIGYLNEKKLIPLVGYDEKGVYFKDKRVCTWTKSKEGIKVSQCPEEVPFEFIEKKNKDGIEMYDAKLFVEDVVPTHLWAERLHGQRVVVSYDSDLNLDIRELDQSRFAFSAELKKKRIKRALDSGLRKYLSCFIADESCGLRKDFCSEMAPIDLFKKILAKDGNYQNYEAELDEFRLRFRDPNNKQLSEIDFELVQKLDNLKEIEWSANESCWP